MQTEKIIKPTLLIAEKTNFLSTQLGSFDFDIVVTHSSEEAYVKYMDLFEKHKYFIAIIDTNISESEDDIEWQSVLQEMYGYSPVPNIIVVDEFQTSEKQAEFALEAVFKGAWGVAIRHQEIEDWQHLLGRIQEDTVPYKKVADICFRDKDWSRYGEEQVNIIRCIVSGFESFLEELNTKQKGSPSMGLVEGIVPHYFESSLTLQACHKGVHRYFSQHNHQLKKPQVLVAGPDSAMSPALHQELSVHFEVSHCHAMPAVLETLSKQRIDMVLLYDHFQFSHFKEACKSVEIVVVHPFDMPSEAESLLRQGAFYLVKPNVTAKKLIHIFNKAWIRRVWPFFEQRMDIQQLDLMQRVYILQQLINIRERMEKESRPDHMTFYQERAWLAGLYTSDLFGLFPEFLDIPT